MHTKQCLNTAEIMWASKQALIWLCGWSWANVIGLVRSTSTYWRWHFGTRFVWESADLAMTTGCVVYGCQQWFTAIKLDMNIKSRHSCWLADAHGLL